MKLFTFATCVVLLPMLSFAESYESLFFKELSTVTEFSSKPIGSYLFHHFVDVSDGMDTRVNCSDSRSKGGGVDSKYKVFLRSLPDSSPKTSSGNLNIKNEGITVQFSQRQANPKKPGSYNVAYKAIKTLPDGKEQVIGKGYLDPSMPNNVISESAPWLKCTAIDLNPILEQFKSNVTRSPGRASSNLESIANLSDLYLADKTSPAVVDFQKSELHRLAFIRATQ